MIKISAISLCCLCALLFIYLPVNSYAQQADNNHSLQKLSKKSSYKISSGSAFYVSSQGYLVTSAHVVNRCQDAYIYTEQDKSKSKNAIIISSSEANDLALLKVDEQPPSVAILRNKEDWQVGDIVTLPGFPFGKKHQQKTPNGISNLYIAKSEIISLLGPGQETKWLQIADSASRGNSGGPLLDEYGQVIGLIAGKAKFVNNSKAINGYQDSDIIRKSDVAVRIGEIKKFLKMNNVNYKESLNRYGINNNYERFVVNVRCVINKANNNQI